MANVQSYLELSTGHVTKEVAEQLDMIVKQRGEGQAARWPDGEWQYWIIAERWSDYGWWVWPNMDEGFDLLPACLQACFRLASENGCRWILFDADSQYTPELLLFDW